MLRRSLLAAASLLALDPAGASADVTATYGRPGTASALTIEVALNGDVRAGNDQAGYFLWTKGQGYEVRPGPGGPSVIRTADTAAARVGARPASQIMRPWLPADTVTINGRTGTRYFIDGARHNPGAVPLVISGDPSLATLAAGYRRYAAMQESSFPGDDSPERISFRETIARGAPIAFYGMQLVTVSVAAIPAPRFRVPAEPIAAALVRQRADAVRAAMASTTTLTPEEVQRGRDRFIKRAVWASGRLWLLTDSGTLSSVAPGERSRRVEPTPEPVAEICVAGAAPVVLGSGGQLSRLEGGSWRASQRLALDGESIQAISCNDRRVIVVTRRHVATLENERLRYAALSKPLSGPITRTAPFDTGAALLLGTDQGEWGGSLERIDTTTGAINEVPGLVGPINGVGPEPGRPDCLVTTVGLVHMFPHGQVVEVCGNTVRRLYYKPYTIETSWPADPPKLPFETVPFYTLAEAGSKLWIAGGDGLYAITANRPIAFRKMPPFEQIDGVDISFAVPGLALVRTDIDARVSLGGGAPLLVAR